MCVNCIMTLPHYSASALACSLHVPNIISCMKFRCIILHVQYQIVNIDCCIVLQLFLELHVFSYAMRHIIRRRYSVLWNSCHGIHSPRRIHLEMNSSVFFSISYAYGKVFDFAFMRPIFLMKNTDNKLECLYKLL
jgi:hypothetical protein